jgi:flagellar export protein FliJ
MKKFQFKLEKLLHYKDQLLENELMRLAALNETLRQAVDQQNLLTSARDGCRLELAARQRNGELSPAAYQLYFRYETYLKEEIGKTERRIEQITAQVEAQIEVIRNLRLETKSLEIMKTAKLAAYTKESLKEAEREVDEFVNTAKAMRQ